MTTIEKVIELATNLYGYHRLNIYKSSGVYTIIVPTPGTTVWEWSAHGNRLDEAAEEALQHLMKEAEYRRNKAIDEAERQSHLLEIASK